MTVRVTICGHGAAQGEPHAEGHGAPQSFFLRHSPPNSPRRPLSQLGAGAGATAQVTVTGTHTHSVTVCLCFVTTGTCEYETTSTSLVTAFVSATFTFSLTVVHSCAVYL